MHVWRIPPGKSREHPRESPGKLRFHETQKGTDGATECGGQSPANFVSISSRVQKNTSLVFHVWERQWGNFSPTCNYPSPSPPSTFPPALLQLHRAPGPEGLYEIRARGKETLQEMMCASHFCVESKVRLYRHKCSCIDILRFVYTCSFLVYTRLCLRMSRTLACIYKPRFCIYNLCFRLDKNFVSCFPRGLCHR